MRIEEDELWTGKVKEELSEAAGKVEKYSCRLYLHITATIVIMFSVYYLFLPTC